MKKEHWLILLCCWVVALGAGLALGRLGADPGTQAGQTGAEVLRSARGATGVGGTGQTPGGALSATGDAGGAQAAAHASGETGNYNKRPMTVAELLEMEQTRDHIRSIYESTLMTEEFRQRVTPEQAMQLLPQYLEAIENDPDVRYPRLLSNLFSTLAHGKDPVQALNMAKALDDESHRQTAIYGVLSSWFHDDAQFEKLVSQMDDKDQEIVQNMRRSQMLRGKSNEERFDILLREVEEEPDQNLGHQVGWALAQMVHEDPEKALRRLEEIDNDWIAQESAENLASGLAHQDLEKALELVDQVSDPLLRVKMLDSMIQSLAYNEPEKAAEVLEKLLMSPRARNRVWNIARYYSQQDPVKAREWAEGLPAGEMRSSAIQQVAAQAAKERPMETWEWIQKMPEGDTRNNARTTALSGIMETDKDLALTLFEQLTETNVKRNAISRIMSDWASDDPQAAQDYAARIQDDDLRSRAVQSIGSQMGYQRPEEGVKWVKRLQGKDKTEAVESLARGWGNANLEGAAAWVDQLKPGPARDAGVEAITGRVAQNDPEGAVMWSTTISDQKKRENQVTRYARRWMEKDAPAARAWIAGSNLPEEKKADLLKKK